MRRLLFVTALLASACSGGAEDGGGDFATVVAEVEPNGTLELANTVIVSGGRADVREGTIASSADLDYFQLDVYSPTPFVQVRALDATGSGCEGIDPSLELYTGGGAGTLIEAAGDNGLAACGVISVDADAARVTYLQVAATTGAPFDYRLAIAAPAEPASHATESEPNDGVATADGAYSSDVLIAAGIGSASDRDYFRVSNEGSSPVKVHVETFTGAFGKCTAGLNDTAVTVIDVIPTTVAADDDGGLSACSSVDFSLPAHMTDFIEVTGASGVAYSLWIDFGFL